MADETETGIGPHLSGLEPDWTNRFGPLNCIDFIFNDWYSGSSSTSGPRWSWKHVADLGILVQHKPKERYSQRNSSQMDTNPPEQLWIEKTLEKSITSSTDSAVFSLLGSKKVEIFEGAERTEAI